MRTCPYCENALSDTARHCSRCGQTVPLPTDPDPAHEPGPPLQRWDLGPHQVGPILALVGIATMLAVYFSGGAFAGFGSRGYPSVLAELINPWATSLTVIGLSIWLLVGGHRNDAAAGIILGIGVAFSAVTLQILLFQIDFTRQIGARIVVQLLGAVVVAIGGALSLTVPRPVPAGTPVKAHAAG